MEGHTLKLDLGTDRHLIVGDIHGLYSALLKLLDQANYDPASDIVYTVGDMIDRGPRSVDVVEFFRGERRYAIKGNHELMMLNPDEWLGTWISKNGGGIATLKDIRDKEIEFGWFQDIVDQFPWVIDVGENDEEHAFRLIHAEMPPGWPESYFQKMLNDAIDHNDLSFVRCIWGRKLCQAAQTNVKIMMPADRGIQFHKERFRTVFVGHTPLSRTMKCGDHWYIDTAFGGKLTMMDAVTKETFAVDLSA